MSTAVTLNGVSYLIPDTGEGGWGVAVTNYLVALSSGVLQKAGGNFTLTANVDFGANFGLRTQFYTTRTANLASAGEFRMARADVINWRNQADGANLSLAVNSSDQLTFDGNPISSLALGAANTVLKVNSGGTDTEYGLLTNANIAASATADIALNKLVATTASRALETDGSGYIVASATTAAELALLSGVTALIDDPLTTRGDIIIRNATVPARLPVGAAETILFSDGTDPSWASLDTKIRTTQAIGNLTSTGLLTGGDLTIDTDTTKFDIAAGTGIVVDNYTDPTSPTYSHVSWGAFDAQTVTNIGTQVQTFILIDSNGAIVQQATLPTPSQLRDYIFIGDLLHFDMVNIVAAANTGFNASIDSGLGLVDLSYAIGAINVFGNVYSANGANLNIDKSAGEAHVQNINYHTDRQTPSRLTVASTTAGTFIYSRKDGSGGYTLSAASALIDPANYDDGDGTLGTVTANKWTIQRIYTSATLVGIEYGQNLYNTEAGALAAISTESHDANPALDGTLLRCFLITRGGATDLSDATHANFVEAGKFGGQGSNGGTSSTTDLQQAYNNSSPPQIVLTAAGGGLVIEDAATPIAADLWSVRINGGASKFASVDANGLYVGATHDASAGIDLTSTTQGIGLPNMTTTQRDAISTPKTGLLIENTTTGAMNRYNGSSWEAISVSTLGTATPDTEGKVTSFTPLVKSTVKDIGDALYLILDADGFDLIKTEGTPLTADRTVTLPTASANAGREIQFKKGDTGDFDFVVDGEDAELIDGVSEKRLRARYDSLILRCNGVGWQVVKSNALAWRLDLNAGTHTSDASNVLTDIDNWSTSSALVVLIGGVTLASSTSITIPTGGAGLYYVGFSVDWDDSSIDSGVSVQSQVLLNGATKVISHKLFTAGAGNNPTQNQNGSVLLLADGDTLKVQTMVNDADTSDTSTDISGTFFCGHKLNV